MKETSPQHSQSLSSGQESVPEPWLRGPLEHVHPLMMPVYFSFTQVREDLAKCTPGLTNEQLWQKIGGNSLGFQLKHLAGSVDRLTTYLAGSALTVKQLDFLRDEQDADISLDRLLALLEQQLSDSERQLAAISPDSLYESRSVGRLALPTSVIGLIVHLAEHTQRHLGQAILIAKLLRTADV